MSSPPPTWIVHGGPQGRRECSVRSGGHGAGKSGLPPKSPPLLVDDRDHLLDELLLTGRTLRESDALDAPNVAIVNEVLAGMAALGACGRKPLDKAVPIAQARFVEAPAVEIPVPALDHEHACSPPSGQRSAYSSSPA